MKRRILSLFLALTLCLGLTIPVMATDDELIPLPEWSNGLVGGQHYFHNGLAPINTANGWHYVNTKGELMPESYCHAYIFDYSEGYAAFADFVSDDPYDFTLKVGYMDVNGKVVIPAKYDFYEVAVGRVIDGEALVYNAADDSWEQINMKGQKVPRTLNPDDENVLISDYVGNTDGVTFETVVVDGEAMELGFSEGYALHYEYIVKQGYEPKEDLTIYFDERDFQFDTGVAYHYTLANNTTEAITGHYALLSYKPEHDTFYMSAQFHIFDVNLAPGETVSGTLSSGFYELSQAKMCWLEFEDKAELDSFFADSAFFDYGDYYDVIGSYSHNVAWLEGKLGTSLER